MNDIIKKNCEVNVESQNGFLCFVNLLQRLVEIASPNFIATNQKEN